MEGLIKTYYHVASISLLLIGFYILIVSPNLIKKVLGINIMETAVFLFLGSLGRLGAKGWAPILIDGVEMTRYVDPVPQYIVILGVLITLGVTSLALVLIIKIFNNYRTLNCTKLRRMI